ncbi:UBP1-associated protein 2A-like [Tripterygium wilfordii]|uniref:UBP1-associated protein 2A-like n=1 Tax=Tripterygium wilfordii TaxID=458696 RepID=A0A7J7DZA0_TRIWF|nr:UBP1-associated protein 2B-like [Tripterygium wilfordii]KAF5751647.1 UBP1-associated protein 2A-like [Tripterygium wilfordii]
MFTQFWIHLQAAAISSSMAKKQESGASAKAIIPERKVEDTSESESESESEEEEEVEAEAASSSSDSSSSEEEEEEESSESESEDEGLKLESIKKLLQPFSKDQLIAILKEAAEADPSLAAKIASATDSDPVHRKIFVHGLGWDTTTETLISIFKQYGSIEDCNAVADKATGRCKGYGFVLFKTRAATRKALMEPQKKVGNRMASCQLAATGTPTQSQYQQQIGVDASARKLYVGNVGPQISVGKLRSFFTKFGEIEEGPLGLDKTTRNFRGYALILYKTLEGIKKALEEPVKVFEGVKLHCSLANEGRAAKNNMAGGSGASMGEAMDAHASSVPGNVAIPGFPLGLNQAFVGQSFNPGTFGQSFNPVPGAILLGHNPALGVLNPVLGIGGMLSQTALTPPFPSGVSQPLNRIGNAAQVGLGGAVQPALNDVSPSIIGSYGSQPALQVLGAYQSSQSGQSSSQSKPTTTAGSAPSYSTTAAGSVPSYFGR